MPQRALERDIEWGRLIGFENILHVLLNLNNNRRAANHQRRLRKHIQSPRSELHFSVPLKREFTTLGYTALR